MDRCSHDTVGESLDYLGVSRTVLRRFTILIYRPSPHGQYICSRPTADPVFGISLDLKTFKNVCEDQFAPFHGLWKYTKNLDYYPETIFRFPLRKTPDSSSISKGRKHLEPKEARRLMESYFDEARISLLFLRNVKSLNFKIRGQSSAWSVTRKPSPGDGISFAKPVDFSIRKSSADMTHVTGIDRWMVAIKQYISKDNLIPPTSRKARKNTECGLAALVCSVWAPINLSIGIIAYRSLSAYRSISDRYR